MNKLHEIPAFLMWLICYEQNLPDARLGAIWPVPRVPCNCTHEASLGQPTMIFLQHKALYTRRPGLGRGEFKNKHAIMAETICACGAVHRHGGKKI